MKLRFLVGFLSLTCLGGLAHGEMVHRWSFNGAAVAAVANGAGFADSISGAVATVRSGVNDATIRQAALTTTAITLPGSTTGNQPVSSISAYLDLPNGIVSAKPNFTVEGWITPLSSQSWQRMFDFGRSSVTSGTGAIAGEITTPTAAPGAYTALDNVVLSLNNNTVLGSHRLEGRLGGAAVRNVDTNLATTTTTGTEYHYAMTVADMQGTFGAGGCLLRWYRNGTLQGTVNLPYRLPQMSDVNNWIGRSQYGNDRCANITVNELRLYNHALTAAELAANVVAGPNPSFALPVAVADAQTLHRGQKALIAVLANDTGVLASPTVVVVSQPTWGTAVVQPNGRILYTHTTGTPSADSFTYRVSGPGGTSAAALVSLNFAETLRIANAGFNVPAAPPTTAVQLVNAFTGLTFAAPICLRTLPGDAQRLFVVERNTGLRVIQNVAAAIPTSTQVFAMNSLLAGRTPAETLLTNGENGFLSVALHPDFNTNGYVFLFYSVQYSSTSFQRISRVTLANPSTAAPTLTAGSEVVFIEQLDQASNHNGGDLHFGADGYLYISLGDEGDQNDARNNSQRIDKDFFSSILRIDVDKKPGNLAPNPNPNPVDYPTAPPADAVRRTSGVANYAIPVDNPYVTTSLGGPWNGSYNGTALASTTYVRSEIYASGMRNPWRMAFDAPTGELWVGDVGGGAREEVDIVVKGGNYGWAYREGNTTGPKSAQTPANFTTLHHTPPVYDYGHGNGPMLGDSITGGMVYRGTRFPSLAGAYIFCDYVDGNVWSLQRSPTLNVQRLLGETNIVAFGHDPSNGDVLACNLSTGSIRRLVVDTTPGTAFPATLGATNLFADLTDLSPAPGLLPYTVNLPFWSDHGLKTRWMAIPDAASSMTWRRDGAWTFPAGQLWIKHFDLEMTRGNPASKKRIETRLLVKNSTGAYGVTYQWNAAGTEATLAPDAGADLDLSISVAGNSTAQRWRIPSRAECMSCHNATAGFALSSNTWQLNLANTIHGFGGNQIETLAANGYFTNIPSPAHTLPRHVRGEELSFPAEARARSWLAVNCAYCHMPGTGIPGDFDLQAHVPLAQTMMIQGEASNNGGNAENKLIVPGSPLHSIIYNRAGALNGFTRMPPLVTSVVDQPAVDLLEGWIANDLPDRLSYAAWRLTHFGNANSVEGEPTADPDKDGATNLAEFHALSHPWSGTSFVQPAVSYQATTATVSLTLPANRSAIIQVSSDLNSWSAWNVAGNGGLPTSGGPVVISGPVSGARQYFRVLVTEK